MKVLLVDSKKCTACRLCEMICSYTKEKTFNPAKSRITVVTRLKDGEAVPTVCHHCVKPACMTACAVGAIYRDETTNAVLINYDKCIGCRICVDACPIGGMLMDEAKGVVKCDLCNGDPECVKYCKIKAIQYIEMDKGNIAITEESAQRMIESAKPS